MNRRQILQQALLGVGSGALSLLTASKAAPSDVINVAPTGTVSVSLPSGLVELTSAAGDTLEVMVPSTGIVTLQYERMPLLRGLWEIYKPGTTTSGNKLDGTRPFFDPIVARSFDLLDSTIVPQSEFTRKIWAFRHPVDYPGIALRGVQGSPMYVFLDSGLQPIGPIIVDLVDLDIEPKVYQDLSAIPFPPLPPVSSVINSWRFPAGVGGRQINLNPIEIPWNARCLAIVARLAGQTVYTPMKQTAYVRLRSLRGPLEIIR